MCAVERIWDPLFNTWSGPIPHVTDKVKSIFVVEDFKNSYQTNYTITQDAFTNLSQKCLVP